METFNATTYAAARTEELLSSEGRYALGLWDAAMQEHLSGARRAWNQRPDASGATLPLPTPINQGRENQ